MPQVTTRKGSWWVEIIYSYWNPLQENYPKVINSPTKPSTGPRATFMVTGVEGPFKSKAIATKAAQNYTGIINHGGVGSGDKGGGGGGLLGLGYVDDFFHRLSEKATWIRVGEVALGGILLFVGVHAVFRGSEAQSAVKSVTRPVKKVAKTGMQVALPEATPAVRGSAARAKIRRQNVTTRTTVGPPHARTTTTTVRKVRKP